MLFSQRHGYKSVKDLVQRESMDSDLRVGLWNVLDLLVWSIGRGGWVRERPMQERLVRSLWHSYFKRPLDTISDWWPDVLGELRAYFFASAWNEVYDFLEFVVQNMQHESSRTALTEAFNAVLEREVSAYRFVGNRVTEITSPEEITAIDEALAASGSLPSVATHLRRAVELLADRESPDYRNSIKESISAVEAAANLLAGTSGKTLGEAMKGMELDLHAALDEAFRKLYGYTSDAEGIRHALMDEPNLGFEDAKFMLVTCSAFVNYLVAKGGRGGTTRA